MWSLYLRIKNTIHLVPIPVVPVQIWWCSDQIFVFFNKKIEIWSLDCQMHAEFHANFFANGNKTYAACSSKGLGWRDGEFQERRTTIRNNLTVRVRRNRCLWYFEVS